MDRFFIANDLTEAPTEMDRTGVAGHCSRPRDTILDREVNLERAGPCRKRRYTRATRCGSRSPKMSAAIDGDTSNITTSLGGRWSAEVTCTPVSILPPWRSMSEASASAIARDPPSATTQPSACPAMINISPMALVIGRSSRENACAATPAQSALACSVRHIRPTMVAGSIAATPKRASVNG